MDGKYIGKHITFRFRDGKDDDIATALKNEEETNGLDRSNIIRLALRCYLLEDDQSSTGELGGISRNRNRSLDSSGVDDLEMDQAEKSDEEVDAALDNLLDEF